MTIAELIELRDVHFQSAMQFEAAGDYRNANEQLAVAHSIESEHPEAFYAHGQDGNPVVISFEAARALRALGRAFVHKPASLQKLKKPVQVDDFGPEAA